MGDFGPLEIKVFQHVFDRQDERCLEQLTRHQIRQQVLAGFLAGRLSRGKPAWLRESQPFPGRHGREYLPLYVWTEDRGRCYVVDTPKPELILVRTLLVPGPPMSAFRDKLLAWWRRNGGSASSPAT
jgi:hypothetical protein